MNKEFVAFRGAIYLIEWYFDGRGKSTALKDFEDLPVDRKKKLFRLFQLLGDNGKIFNIEKFRNEGDQIYAFKSDSDRFFCFFFDGSKVIVTNAYEKKSDKMSLPDKQRALKNKKDYEKRCREGDYYD